MIQANCKQTIRHTQSCLHAKTRCTAKINNKASSAASKQRSYKTISANEFHRHARVSEQHIAGHRYSQTLILLACVLRDQHFRRDKQIACIYLAAPAMLKSTDEERLRAGMGWSSGGETCGKEMQESGLKR